MYYRVGYTKYANTECTTEWVTQSILVHSVVQRVLTQSMLIQSVLWSVLTQILKLSGTKRPYCSEGRPEENRDTTSVGVAHLTAGI